MLRRAHRRPEVALLLAAARLGLDGRVRVHQQVGVRLRVVRRPVAAGGARGGGFPDPLGGACGFAGTAGSPER